MKQALREHRRALTRRLVVFYGLRQSEVARLLHVSAATVSRDIRRKTLRRPAWRPAYRATLSRCMAVYREIKSQGRRASVRKLRECFSAIPRAWLERMLRAYRVRKRRRRRQRLAKLTWHLPGAVWAIDFTEPLGRKGPILFHVRDLSSGYSLAAKVVRSESSVEALRVLLPLMVKLGSPVVLKADNGAAFISYRFKRSMEVWGVTLLFSPPYCPSYNGACERGHRLLMDVARELQGSSRAALPLEEILPDARIDLNAKPTRRLSGQSPAQRWRDRPAISADLRVHFSALLKDSRSRIRAEEGIAPDAKLSHRKQARIDRKAIQDVLLETHLLTIRRGDFGQGFLPRNVA
jgi:transposase InsO family protein